jgi:hypothetical protein
MYQAINIMKTLNVIGGIVVATILIIALSGFAIGAAPASLLVQTADATTDVMTKTVGEEEQALRITNTSANNNTTTNNNSNAVLGRLFEIVEFKTASVNPVNQTYIEASTVNNVTIIPPNSTAMTINATEIANATINILPNGLAIDKGQSLIVTEGDDDGSLEQENATTTFVDISRTNPDGTRSGTGVVFFSTNSTGNLAFLDNMVGIMQSEFSSNGGTIRIWEWKAETFPFETVSAPAMGNQNTISSALDREQEALGSMTTSTTNYSNAVLGSLFSFGEGTEATVNPINETYRVISYSGNRVIIAPNTIGVLINSTETGNLTVNLQPNGLSIMQGQAFIMTEDDSAEKEENATITFVMLSRTNPDGTGTGTSPTFFSTNSTGQLAFLDNIVAIGQTKFSPEETSFLEWEWKGGTLPFQTDAATTGNRTMPTSTLEEEE